MVASTFANHANCVAQIGGEPVFRITWWRVKDRLGLVGGWLRASGDFSADAPVLDADGVESADFGYQPDGAECIAELYYAWPVNDHLELTPDLQWVSLPGADGSTDGGIIVGLRDAGVLIA